MSFVTVPQYAFPRSPEGAQSAATVLTAGTTLDLNGVGQYMAYVDFMPSTETIDRAFFRIHDATTGCDALVRVETIDDATGLPTGTLVHANASQTVTIASGGADYEVTFPGTFSITRGTKFALVIAQSSGTPVAVRMSYFREWKYAEGIPYVIDFDANAATRHNLSILAGLGTSGSAVSFRDIWPINAVTAESFANTDAPDTIGNKMVIDAPMRVCGAWAWVDADATGTLKLYDTDGVAVLASAAIDTNVPPTSAPYVAYYMFATSVELPAGTYYLAAEATSGSDIRIFSATFYSAAWRAGSPMGGDRLTYSTCTQTPTSTASWTDDATKQAFMGLIIDGIESGGGGGGGGETSHVFAS